MKILSNISDTDRFSEGSTNKFITAAEKAALHSHANISLLDLIDREIKGIVHYGSVTPSDAKAGDLWVDTRYHVSAVKYFTGAEWYLLTTSTYLSNVNPTTANTAFKGTLWINTGADTIWYKYSDGQGGWYQINAGSTGQTARPPQTYISGVTSPSTGRYTGDLAVDLYDGYMMFWTGGMWKRVVT